MATVSFTKDFAITKKETVERLEKVIITAKVTNFTSLRCFFYSMSIHIQIQKHPFAVRIQVLCQLFRLNVTLRKENPAYATGNNPKRYNKTIRRCHR
jgi:hypothetical protein